MDVSGRKKQIAVVVLIAVSVAAYVAPEFVGALLSLLSVLVFVLAMVGLVWPSLIRLPSRLASVWVFAVSVGLSVGGGVLLSPQNGENTASDEVSSVAGRVPDPETPEGREARSASRSEAPGIGESTASDEVSLVAGRMPDPETPEEREARSASRSEAPGIEEVYASTWSDGPWPLTIDAGVLSCAEVPGAGQAAIIADENGTVWALNGIARSYVPLLGGQADIGPIWRDNPAFPGLGMKVSIGPLIERALRLC